jgi:hypothetical protein
MVAGKRFKSSKRKAPSRAGVRKAKARTGKKQITAKPKRRYKYEDHMLTRASFEIAPCDQKRHQTINLRDWVDSKGVFHKADIYFESTTLTSSGTPRKQKNYRIVEWDYVNRELGVVMECDGVGHYSHHAFGSYAFLAGRENDLIKEEFCRVKKWIMKRVSNVKTGDRSKCCGIPVFNRRMNPKIDSIKRMLNGRGIAVRGFSKRQTQSTPLVPPTRFELIQQIATDVNKIFS